MHKSVSEERFVENRVLRYDITVMPEGSSLLGREIWNRLRSPELQRQMDDYAEKLAEEGYADRSMFYLPLIG